MTMLNHEAFGPLRYGTYGNDLSAFRQYTSGYELKSSYVGGGWAPLTTEYQNFYFQAPYISQAKLAYNSAGNIVSIEDVLGSELESFTYDNRSRLTQRKRNGNSLEVYNYDANGNRTRFNNEYYRVDADSNQLTGHRVGASGSYASIWSYDNAGNQLQKETHTWTYGGDNRVRRLTRSSGFYYENWYDTNGQRVAKSSTTTDWHFLYGQSGELLSETKNGPHVKSYIWLEGELVALVYNDELYFVHNDHLGRPHKVTDDTKAVVWEADLQSFDRSIVSSSIGALNIGFPGQYWDSESGTWQNWHRDYDPSTGRYIQSDPIGLSGGMNTYVYVESDPLIQIDPDGTRQRVVRTINPNNQQYRELRDLGYRHDQIMAMGEALYAFATMKKAPAPCVCPTANSERGFYDKICTSDNPTGADEMIVTGPIMLAQGESPCRCGTELSVRDFVNHMITAPAHAGNPRGF
ncbi:hypothetical protein NOG12_12280 [Pseudidiomarina sp. GXY010]|uniref:Teneurin-like YD-shell domain-containing protein n=1 Tax=Pseudidiomarina fusca TaxID=2965078 RepID=A0ABU3L0J7_9GAMM|nr:RHS repeat-associated core domain-containing protein [Pseudidiomarina sp. GXY010]MDT7526850.1 hypothetical protein [Pseudidiomarina sp. GXY010]